MADIIQEMEEKFQYHFERARGFLKDGDFISAREEVELALEVKPGDDRALNLLGMIYFKIEDYEKAVKIFRQLLRRNPNINSLRINLGLAYLKLGEYDEATEVLREAVILDESNEKAHNYLGYALYNLGRLEEALEEFRKGRAEKMIHKIEEELGGKETKISSVEGEVEELPPGETSTGEVPASREEEEIEEQEEAPSRPVAPEQTPEASGEEERSEEMEAASPEKEEARADVKPEEEIEGVAGDSERVEETDKEKAVSEPSEAVEEPVQEDVLPGFVPLSEVPPAEGSDVEERVGESEEKAEQVSEPSAEAKEEVEREEEEIKEKPEEEKEEEEKGEEELYAQETPTGAEHEEKVEETPVSTQTVQAEQEEKAETQEKHEVPVSSTPVQIEKVHTYRDGNMHLKLLDRGFYIRSRDILLMKGSVKLEDVRKRYRGKELKSSFGPKNDPISKLYGTGSISVDLVGISEPFEVEVKGDELFIIENYVLGFSDTLGWENGKLAGGDREINMVRFQGFGYVIFRAEKSSVIKIENVDPDDPMSVPLERIIGWKGRFVPSLSKEGEKVFISLRGEGYLFLKK